MRTAEPGVRGRRAVTWVLEPVGAVIGWGARLRSPGQRDAELSLHPVGFAARPLVCVDGLTAALLPVAMRGGGGVVRVEAALTREALRNLTEYAETWAHWAPARYRRVELRADRILDEARPPADRSAVVAWSGGLRSTHTLVRHAAGLVAGAFSVRAAVRVLGLDDGDPAAESLPPALPSLGLPLVAVRTNAAAAGLVDPEIGPLPVVAAALHAAGAGCAAGLHARRWHFRAQLRYPRPEPALHDLLSGDAFTVRADGGAVSPPRMVTDLAAHPELAAAVSGCSRRPACGRCVPCALVGLAFLAAGRPRADLRPGVARIAALPFAGPVAAADAEATLNDWPDDRSGPRRVLERAVGAARLARDLRDTARWLGAASGLRAPWPR